jgi:hypothetical protein
MQAATDHRASNALVFFAFDSNMISKLKTSE